MKYYVRIIDNQCINKQISVTKPIMNEFFNDPKDQEIRKFKGKKTGVLKDIKALLSTDPRFNNELKNLLKAEKGTKLSVGDIMLITYGTPYIAELITKGDARYTELSALVNINKKHALIERE